MRNKVSDAGTWDDYVAGFTDLMKERRIETALDQAASRFPPRFFAAKRRLSIAIVGWFVNTSPSTGAT